MKKTAINIQNITGIIRLLLRSRLLQRVMDVLAVVLIFLIMDDIPSCSKATIIDNEATISPAYPSTVIPYNIAPFNFNIHEEGSRYRVRFAVAGRDSFTVSTKKSVVSIPLRKWKKLLHANRGEQMDIRIFVKKETGWVRYAPLRLTIATEPIDPWLAYRLIEPGYEIWNRMGIYQRCLENFDEIPIFTNQLTENRSCMNCHSFCRNNPQTMLFHLRKYDAGTIILKDGTVEKVNTQVPGLISAGVYPRWHPDGRFVAFSVNITRQGFHATHTNKVEVYDQKSDVMIYDTETHTIFTDNLISSADCFETFPEWSPDGRHLYFCSASACPMPQAYDSLQYDLLRISFDASNRTFGKQLDTIISSRQLQYESAKGRSIALPRLSPDGKYIVFCLSDYGTFPIWHRENDLYLLNVETKEWRNLSEINSDQSDSYHAWSSNGRWIVFSSRRIDGTFTRPYISYFDTAGNAYTPFLLPQKDPFHYDFSFKSYNIPEFITGKVTVSPYKLLKTAKNKAIESKR